MEIKRDAYLQQLTLRKDNGMIKVITGIRDVASPFCCLPSLRDTYWRTALMLTILLRLHWMVLKMRN